MFVSFTRLFRSNVRHNYTHLCLSHVYFDLIQDTEVDLWVRPRVDLNGGQKHRMNSCPYEHFKIR